MKACSTFPKAQWLEPQPPGPPLEQGRLQLIYHLFVQCWVSYKLLIVNCRQGWNQIQQSKTKEKQLRTTINMSKANYFHWLLKYHRGPPIYYFAAVDTLIWNPKDHFRLITGRNYALRPRKYYLPWSDSPVFWVNLLVCARAHNKINSYILIMLKALKQPE